METDKKARLARIDEALAFAQAQVRALVERDPDFYPLYTDGGRWRHSKPAWTRWCDGFLPGIRRGKIWRLDTRKRSSRGKTIAMFTISVSSSITVLTGVGTKPLCVKVRPIDH